MQTLTKRPIPRPIPAATLASAELRLSAPSNNEPVAIPAPLEADARKGSDGVSLGVAGLALKIARGISLVYSLLAGPPMTKRDRATSAVTVAQVQQQAMANLWSSKPTRGI